ncbi:MAG: hypothetical protein H2049_13445 [Porphyrobacter sp.]|nr:hypothetical protein [Porphyrobacter sp.]
MSAHFAQPLSCSDRAAGPHYLRAQWQSDRAPAGVAGHAEALTSLEVLPWLAPSGPGPAVTPATRKPQDRERIGLMLHVGLAAALAVLGGGAWYASGNSAVPPAPAMPQTLAPQDTTPADPALIAAIAASDGAAATEQSAADAAALVDAQPDPVAGPPRTQGEAAAARATPAATAPGRGRTLAPVTRIVQAPAAEADADTAMSLTAPPPPPVADSPATSATLRQYRSAMDECRDAIRTIIRLGDRQRPGRDATAAELASYRLRQQNAAAAKSYRAYLDTLARSVRATNSETLTRQSLERARQTRGYLDTMLADSKAALR